ncbi:MAG TPA: DUF6770 family protein [Puia sp.]|nr:DUF6770 family protein [Puia sp.]
MKKSAFSVILLAISLSLHAQTRIFKEVGEDISTQIKAISQNNSLVGYLAFTRLEKADADSFNYRLTIMDENLNEIGKVNFRQVILDLQAVSFEGNTLCVGYIQSGLRDIGAVRAENDLRRAQEAAMNSHILLQFLSLDGKLLDTYYKEVNLDLASLTPRRPFAGTKIAGYLKYGMQIRNIPNYGFAVFYGDEMSQQMLEFDSKGAVVHEQQTPTIADHFYLHASAAAIYLLTKRDVPVPEGGYTLYVYSARDLSAQNNFDLRDADGNWLKVLTFDSDPRTGDPFIAGTIINPRREKQFLTATDYSYTPYLGLFTLDLGNSQREMHANCSYWHTGNIPGIAADGLFPDKDFYVRYATAFKDFNGNTIFAGTALAGKGFVGAGKYKLTDGVFVRQEPAGSLALDNTIPCDETKYFGATGILLELDKKDYYNVADPDTKTNYSIIDDEENIYVYNVTAKKVVRRIPHKDGNIKINVYPAKEGYMMVAEHNRKEKYTRFSIEAI